MHLRLIIILFVVYDCVVFCASNVDKTTPTSTIIPTSTVSSSTIPTSTVSSTTDSSTWTPSDYGQDSQDSTRPTSFPPWDKASETAAQYQERLCSFARCEGNETIYSDWSEYRRYGTVHELKSILCFRVLRFRFKRS